MDALDASPLCPAPAELQLDEIAFAAPELRVHLRARRRVVACPVCGHAATRVHSRYHRTLADLPWHGLRVRLELRVRRFFCDVPGCSRQIFTERLPKTTASYARRTTRAASALQMIALALGGRAGARLAEALGLVASPATLLTQSSGQAGGDDHAGAASETPRVLGVDDWAWRRGQRYGTILVDLERHAVIDLLPDREPDTLAAWLEAHPGVEFITRDRAGAYAEGARRGAPQAIQIADRFHLLRNLTEAMQHAVERQRGTIRRIGLEPKLPGVTPVQRGRVGRAAGTLPRAVQRQAARRAQRLDRYEQVIALHADGASTSEIHRRVGLSRATVIRWLAVGGFPERRPVLSRTSTVTPHAVFLSARWRAGCHNATRLWRALRDECGFRGGRTIVRDWVRTHLRGRSDLSDLSEGGSALVPPATPRPAARRAAWLLTAPAERLNAAERRYVDAVCDASPPLATAHRLALEFRAMLRAHDPKPLPAWLTALEASELRTLAPGLRRDADAVLAAILFPWSNGQVEGQINRLKLVKRTMYGRASFPLLRRRVLAA